MATTYNPVRVKNWCPWHTRWVQFHCCSLQSHSRGRSISVHRKPPSCQHRMRLYFLPSYNILVYKPNEATFGDGAIKKFEGSHPLQCQHEGGITNASKEHGSRDGWNVGRGAPMYPQTRLTIHHALVEGYAQVRVRAMHHLRFQPHPTEPFAPAAVDAGLGCVGRQPAQKVDDKQPRCGTNLGETSSVSATSRLVVPPWEQRSTTLALKSSEGVMTGVCLEGSDERRSG